MPRSIPAALLAALQSKDKKPFLAYEVLLDSGALRLWSRHGDRQINGQTYTGSKNLVSLGNVDETTDLTANAVSATLSGVPPEILSAALSEPYKGREFNIYLGDLSVTEVMIVYAGYLDTMNPVDGREVAQLTAGIESRLVELQRPRMRRYTKESQRALFPGDSFFDHTADLADKVTPFGRADLA